MGSIPVDLGNGYVMNIDIIGTVIIIFAFALVMLILAILAVAALYRQKAILKSIERKLPPGPPIQPPIPPEGYPFPQGFVPVMPPVRNVCPSCGAAAEPGNMFCQKCGTPL